MARTSTMPLTHTSPAHTPRCDSPAPSPQTFYAYGFFRNLK